jgi:hypothetical protein
MGRFDDCVFKTQLLSDTAGSATNTPRPATDATKKPKGLEWKYQIVPANAGRASRFLSDALGPAWLDSTFGR